MKQADKFQEELKELIMKHVRETDEIHDVFFIIGRMYFEGMIMTHSILDDNEKTIRLTKGIFQGLLEQYHAHVVEG